MAARGVALLRGSRSRAPHHERWLQVHGRDCSLLVAHLSQHPAVGIVRFPERKRKRFVTTAEMPRLIKALEEEENEFARHGIWLLLLTGLRSTELLKAKWTDIDCNMRTLLIGLTKNGEPLLAPVSDAALARLQMVPRLQGNLHIICGRKLGKPLSELGTALKRALKMAAGEYPHSRPATHCRLLAGGAWSQPYET